MARAVLDVIFALLAIWLAVPCIVMAVECLAALPRSEAVASAPPGKLRMAVLVPAYNEEARIFDTVVALRSQLEATDRLLVVADNCTDRTAELALEAGAEVVCRNDPERRGKGYALAFGSESMATDSPDAVVIVDADCRVSEGGLRQLAAEAVRIARPVQAEYTMEVPDQRDARLAISALAFTVRNRVRPRGLRRLGLPCPLTGTGMAFPWHLLQAMPPLGSNLVEDMVLGLESALRGAPPTSFSTVNITSKLPSGAHHQMTQRRRWESGHLDTLSHYGPRLLWSGFVRRRPDLIAMALDLLVPPLALLTLMLTGVGLLCAVHVIMGGAIAPLVTSALATVVLAIAIITAWQRFARAVLPLRALTKIPLYVLWKLPLYVSYLLGRKPRTWQKTGL
jgi:cellulose synthase/poly-beta-1,6-N-acetylglucosamine synthase-like glycosyltransferase